MHPGHRFTVILILTLVATGGRAQTIGPLRQANDPDDPNQLAQECTVAGGRTQATAGELVVAWQDPLEFHGIRGIRYSVSHNAGATWTQRGTFLDDMDPNTLDIRQDPRLSVDPAGRFWLSAKRGSACDMAWKEPVADDLAAIYPATQGLSEVKIPVLAIGPAPGSPSTTHYYLGFARVESGGCDQAAWSADTAQPTLQSAWDDDRVEPAAPQDADYQGIAGGAAVLSTGRFLICFRNHMSCPEYEPNLPYVVWSDNAGQTWFPEFVPPGPVIVASGSNIIQTKLGDFPSEVDHHNRLPAIAVDAATSPNHVYIAFHARTTRGDTTSGDANADIYICRSTDSGQTFPIGAQHLLQLTDATLGLPTPWPFNPGPDQLMPSNPVVDHCGGVNVMFYDSRHDPNLFDSEHWFDVYWVRITGFGTASQSIYQARLTPQSFQLPINAPFLGDYQTMARAGAGVNKVLYAAFIATAESMPGQWNRHNCYVRLITNFCQSDTNLSGSADDDDIALFVTAYNAAQAGAPNAPGPDGGLGIADMNRDGAVDVHDYELFWESYLHLAAEPQ